MKRITRLTALVIAVAIAVAMTALPAFSEVSGKLGTQSVKAKKGIIDLGGETYYKVSTLNDGQRYLIAAEGSNGSLNALTYETETDTFADWTFKVSKAGGSNSKASSYFTTSDVQPVIDEGKLVLGEKSSSDPGDPPPGDKPSGEKPSDKPDKPSDNGNKPADDGNKPADDSDKPADDSDKPADDSDKPADDGDKPADNGDKPADIGDKPADNGDKPADNGDKPADGGDKPDKPADDGNKPEKPADDGDKPSGDKPSSKPGEDAASTGAEDATEASVKPEDMGDKGGKGGTESKTTWNYEGTALSCEYGGINYYLTYSEENDSYGVSESKGDAAVIYLFSCGDKLGSCIVGQPSADSYVIEGTRYKAPVFRVELISGMIVDSITWYIDDKEQDCKDPTFRADSLIDQPAGIYVVYCEVTGHDEQFNYYRDSSVKANFIVASGVLENSVLTFSDVHEEFENIGKAIKEVMDRNGGMIPSLIVNTGDWVNGATADAESLQSDYFPQMIAQQGGIDTVYVSGNHEDSDASAAMTIQSSLGADNSFADGIGVIFNSKNAPAANSSRYDDGLIVYGLNFYAMESSSESGRTYTYQDAYDQLDDFLGNLAKNYHGELIQISSHTGLHVLGIQPESAESEVPEWSGNNEYNVDMSYDVVQLLNKYAEDYGMNIMFLFGHDHSKGEVEFMLTPGSELTSTISYSEKTYDTQTIQFTYGHAGYLSTKIGSADGHYSLVRWNNANIYIDYAQFGGNFSTVTVTKASGGGSDDNSKSDVDNKDNDKSGNGGNSGGSSKNDNGEMKSPKTGDTTPIALWLFILLASFSVIVFGTVKRKS